MLSPFFYFKDTQIDTQIDTQAQMISNDFIKHLFGHIPIKS